jgi:dienelactone hydrolase
MRWSCLIFALASTAYAQPEMRGPRPVMEWDAGDIDAAGASIPVVVVYPSDAGASGPVVAVVHGFLRNGSYQMEMARTFASRGFVAVVPDMPCGAGGCDHDANAAQISALLEWAVDESATSGSEIEGRVDGELRAVVGHSWGGLGTFLAASRDANIDAWVGLDPQEDSGDALDAAPDVAIPNMHLMAEVDGNCNGEWGANVYDATAAPHVRLVITNSGHCDPEDPSDSLCDFACTAGDRSTSFLFRRYAVAFVACALGVDASMEEWIGGSGYDGDVASGRLIDIMEEGLDAMECGAEPIMRDAGIVELDAGSAAQDAGVMAARDAGRDRDAGRANDAGTAMTEGGCGCRAVSQRSSSAIAWITTAIALVRTARSRRSRCPRTKRRPNATPPRCA